MSDTDEAVPTFPHPRPLSRFAGEGSFRTEALRSGIVRVSTFSGPEADAALASAEAVYRVV